MILLLLKFTFTLLNNKSNRHQNSWWWTALEQRCHIWSQTGWGGQLLISWWWDRTSWCLWSALLQGDVFVFKHLDQTATQWCFWCFALMMQTLCSLSLIWNQLNAVTSVSLSTRLSCVCFHSYFLGDIAAVRLNVLCTDVNVWSVHWTGSTWRDVHVKHAVYACCPGNSEKSSVLDQNYQLFCHKAPVGQTRPREGFKSKFWRSADLILWIFFLLWWQL